MKIEWLYEAQVEYRELLSYYRNTVGLQAARRFSQMILGEIEKLSDFPNLGVLKENTLLGRHGFRALFIGKYVCVYRIDEDAVRIFHLADARTNYLYRIFGVEYPERKE